MDYSIHIDEKLPIERLCDSGMRWKDKGNYIIIESFSVI